MFQAEINTKKLDDDDNPLSVNEIESRLWLGNVTAASNLNFIKENNISHILTVESFSLPTYLSSNSNGKSIAPLLIIISTMFYLSVIIKHVQIADMTRENILQHFPICIEFLNNALKDPNGKNGVLVHCYYGVSRSATIVIAYLMKKYNLSYQKAFER